MKLLKVKAYEFKELSDKAKDVAKAKFQRKICDYFDESDDIRKSIDEFNDKSDKCLISVYGDGQVCVKLNVPIDYEVNLKGIRLYKWVMNNLYPLLLSRKYLKHIDGRWIKHPMCKGYRVERGPNKDKKNTFVYSNIQFERNSYPLTGVGSDFYLLNFVDEWLKQPDLTDNTSSFLEHWEGDIRSYLDNAESYAFEDDAALQYFEDSDVLFDENGNEIKFTPEPDENKGVILVTIFNRKGSKAYYAKPLDTRSETQPQFVSARELSQFVLSYLDFGWEIQIQK